MQIPPTFTLQSNPDASSRPIQWQAGQRLQATVLDSGTAQNAARIQIGGREFALQSAIPNAPGQKITLEVVRGGDPPQLRLLPGLSTPSPTQPLLARLLPAQGSQTPMLALLTATQTSKALQASLPAALRESIGAVLRQMPTWTQVTEPTALRESLRNSGLLHEVLLVNALAAGSRPPPNLKSALLGLAMRLRQASESPSRSQTPQEKAPTSREKGGSAPAVARSEIPPPQAHKLPLAQPRTPLEMPRFSAEQILKALGPRTEQAISRLVLHQLDSAQTSDSGQLRWILELPIRTADGIDLLHFKLEEEGHRQGPRSERAWSVELALDLPALGAIHARITVRRDQVSAHLWLADYGTERLFADALPELRAALERRGLQIQELSCQPGPPPEPAPGPARPASGGSLDLHA